ncbi:MAG: multicopper oxidase domain-containing protein [Haloarculaceae archaeon]
MAEESLNQATSTAADAGQSGADHEHAAALTGRLVGRLRDVVAEDARVSRRAVLGGIGVAGAGAVGLGGSAGADEGASTPHSVGESEHGNFGAKGTYEDATFDPHVYLRAFNTGVSGQSGVTDIDEEVPQRVYNRDDGEGGKETVREFEFVAQRTVVEIAPGVDFPAWSYNGQVPGPTLRVEEGDVVRVQFANAQRHAHTIHPHLKNVVPEMDGIPQNGPGLVDQGDSFVYEWRAQPAGLHFYHCHSLPLKEHIHRGLYGAIIVDPDPERVRKHPREYVNYHGPIDDAYVDDLVERAKLRNHRYRADEVDEMVMVMNGFDTNFDGDNEVYAANTQAFCYGVADSDGYGAWEGGETIHPIRIDSNERQRIYLLNVIEFDPINSLHTHSQFFDYYDHGTTLYPTHKTVDTVMQCQAQRGILELDYGDHATVDSYGGERQNALYMFHAHQSEFAELGWMSFFEVVN